MAGRRRRSRLPEGEFEAEIDALDRHGRGVSAVNGKKTLVHGALAGERVHFRYLKRRRNYDEGQVTGVLEASQDRVRPACEHFGVCGGCSLQHLDSAAQIGVKQQALVEDLEQIGRVRPQTLLPPICNESPWGYRRKARLGVKSVARKGRVLVGFRERGSSFVAELNECLVLHPRVGKLLRPLGTLIESLTVSRRLPQIEVVMDDERCVLILRTLDPLTTEDERLLGEFQSAHRVVFYIQPGGPDSMVPLDGPVDLFYELPAYGLTLGFLPGDFTQVNTEINRKMIAHALSLLDPGPSDSVLDLFCGVGNFTLPIARFSESVVGVEGDQGLVQRAQANAERNGLSHVEFYAADLYAELTDEVWLERRYDKALLDPPRSGALEVLPLLQQTGVKKIVYVSCYPGTLARDAGELVHSYGYRLVSAGVMDMFPHTAHVESIALFEKA